ncbi:MAG: hypothetical protein FWD01_03050 [Defluviitaleaceae bacterium]|nr:hypothetical protein [Defluviitaleaceae bacterium]
MKVLLIGPVGASTVILADRVKALANSREAELEINIENKITGIGNLHEYDVLLLAPTIRFMMDDIPKLESFKNTAVATIDSRVFGSLNAAVVLDMILAAHLGQRSKDI